MIHWLQVMWWELEWRRLKSALGLILGALPLEPTRWGRDELIRDAHRIQREMADLEERISGRAK